MRKILFVILLASMVFVIVSIPDADDRLMAIAVFSVMGAAITLTIGWPWLRRNWKDILFCLSLPFLAVLYVIRLIRGNFKSKRRPAPTPEDEKEGMINHFEEPWGIGA